MVRGSLFSMVTHPGVYTFNFAPPPQKKKYQLFKGLGGKVKKKETGGKRRRQKRREKGEKKEERRKKQKKRGKYKQICCRLTQIILLIQLKQSITDKFYQKNYF